MKEYSIDFEDLLIKYDVFLKYAVNNGSYMSFMTFQEKPYSKIPPNCRHDKMTEPLLKFLSKQEVGIRRWANSGEKDNHRVMNIYECQSGLSKRLPALGNLLLSDELDLPEDICFYRNRDIWISTVTHERLAYLYDPSEEDKKFFRENNIEIEFLYELENKLFCLNM